MEEGRCSLQKHTHAIYRKFLLPKKKKIKRIFFLIFAENIDCYQREMLNLIKLLKGLVLIKVNIEICCFPDNREYISL